MAKVSFSKLNLTKDISVNTFEYNDQTIEVKNYLAVEDKMKLLSTILNKTVDENGYYNSGKLYVNMIVEIIMAYTNIGFTEKQKEDTGKLYDILVSSGFSGKVIGEYMNPNEYAQIKTWLSELIHNVYEYKNSVYGILDGITTDYSNLDFDANKIKEQLANGENVEFLKDVLTKLG